LCACQAVADPSNNIPADDTKLVKLSELESEGLVMVDRIWGEPAGGSNRNGVMVVALPAKVIFMGPKPSVDGEIDRQWTCPAVDGKAHLDWYCRKYNPAVDVPSTTD